LTKELYQVISNNHLDLKNYGLAEEYYNKSIQHIPANELKPNDYNLIAEILRLKGNNKESLAYFQKAIVISKKLSNKMALAVLFNNIGLAYLGLDKLDSANYYLNSSLKIINSLNLKNEKSAINISFGKLKLKDNKLLEALNYFKQTITFDLSDHPDQYELYKDAYEGMSLSYELLNMNKEALVSYKNYNKYQSKILNYTKQANIFQNQILNERIIHLKEINLLNQKIELEQKYKKAILLLSGVILLILILLGYALWLRNRSIKQKVELSENINVIQELELEKVKLSNDRLNAENLQHKQEQQLKELEKQQLKEQVDFKNRELTSTALHLINKNEILSDIKDKVTEMEGNTALEQSKAIKRIKFLIKENLHLDNDWEALKKHFTDVHPDFFTVLLNNYSDLTPDELKLCAYLKIQLSSKEIARLINITAIAVNKRRNRLRKKLNLSPNIDLNEFLLNIKSPE